MRITLINQFYRPDISPTAHLTASLAEHRAAMGDEVTVITSGGRYVAPASPSPSTPHAPSSTPTRAPRVIRVWTPALGKGSIVKRLADYASYYLLAAFRALTLPAQDVLVSLTTPPYIAWAGALHKLLHPRRTKLVLWNMDCYPDAAERAGILRRGGVASRLMRAMNRALFRRLDHLVGLDTAMIELLCSQYAPRDTTGSNTLPATIIPNWEDAALFPIDATPAPWPEAEALALREKFVVLYLGNAGTGHSFATALDAAERLKGTNVVFLFVGGGSRWEEVRREKESRGLSNVVMRDYVPKELTPSVLASAGCALITLRDEALGVMSPSKLHSNLASGLPVLYIGPAGSNVDDAIVRFGCGVSLRHGDATGAADFLRRLASDAPLASELRGRARAAFDQAYCDLRTLPQFDELLNRLLEPVAVPVPQS
jgi:glycosyltransferase involved in cell wall biosynthesis